MLRYADALRLLRQAARAQAPLGEEEATLAEALGRVTSRPLTSRESIPPFDNSAMDGYALAAAKAAKVPARLPVLGTIMAGDAPICAVRTGGAWRIMTGAPIPAGADAIVPVEKATSLDGGKTVEILEAPEEGDYVRGAGKDFKAGAQVCPSGTRLGARHLLALAATGISRVHAVRRPRIALLSTGKELLGPGEPLSPGKIRDASSTYLQSAVPQLGADFTFHGIVPDDVKDFERRLERVILGGVDVVLTTGAVSMGEADFIPAALKSLGAEVIFHKVAIRPGKPVFLARFPKGPVFFGLPGNPISTVVGLRFFVEPFLRELLGRAPEPCLRSRLIAPAEKPEGLRCFFKARRSEDGRVEILSGQASFQIHSLLSSDCWAVLPESGARLRKGAEIDVYPLLESLA